MWESETDCKMGDFIWPNIYSSGDCLTMSWVEVKHTRIIGADPFCVLRYHPMQTDLDEMGNNRDQMLGHKLELKPEKAWSCTPSRARNFWSWLRLCSRYVSELKCSLPVVCGASSFTVGHRNDWGYVREPPAVISCQWHLCIWSSELSRSTLPTSGPDFT